VDRLAKGPLETADPEVDGEGKEERDLKKCASSSPSAYSVLQDKRQARTGYVKRTDTAEEH
jgi:hypothetical protein